MRLYDVLAVCVVFSILVVIDWLVIQKCSFGWRVDNVECFVFVKYGIWMVLFAFFINVRQLQPLWQE